jgi:prepilin-type N-terminal cleavage/methylation domain-containing protein
MKNAFTMAEVAITLLIIGVISMLTMPGVITKTQNKTFVTSLKKHYKNLTDNVALLENEKYQTTGLYKTKLHMQNDQTVSDTAGEFLKKYYKIETDCGTSAQPCFADTYQTLNQSLSNFSCSDGYNVLLVDNVAMCLKPAKFIGSAQLYSPAIVIIDVNGAQKPNIAGRDLFTFNIYEDGTIDEVTPSQIKAGTAEADRETLFSNNCKTSSIGTGCFAKILNDNWQMSY